jgi:hypothetical protein
MNKYDSHLWLKTIGTGDSPLKEPWLLQRPDVLKYVGFPDRGTPSVEDLDYFALYLAGHQKIVGVVEATSDPKWLPDKINSDPPRRWPWVVTVQPLLIAPTLRDAPSLKDVGINTLSVRNQSHIALDEATYMRIVGALASSAAVRGERYIAAYAA